MGTTLTGGGITWYRWMVMRSAVELEGKGIKMGRRSMTAQAKRELGIKGSRQKVLDALTVKIEEARMNIQDGEVC